MLCEAYVEALLVDAGLAGRTTCLPAQVCSVDGGQLIRITLGQGWTRQNYIL